jgi:hypothetical protein
MTSPTMFKNLMISLAYFATSFSFSAYFWLLRASTKQSCGSNAGVSLTNYSACFQTTTLSKKFSLTDPKQLS